MSKLFKYDIKSFFKTHLAIYLVLIVNAILAKTSSFIVSIIDSTSEVWPYVNMADGVFSALFTLSVILIPLTTFFMSVSRYKNKVLGDQAYLTHTLPLTKREILFSGIFNTLTYMFVDLIIISLAFLIKNGITKSLDILSIETFTQGFIMVLGLILLAIVYLVIIYQFILAFTLGYSHETNKVRNTIIYGIVIYLVNQFLTVTVMVTFIFGMFSLKRESFMQMLLLLAILFYSGVFAIIYTIIKKRLKNKLNLE